MIRPFLALLLRLKIGIFCVVPLIARIQAEVGAKLLSAEQRGEKLEELVETFFQPLIERQWASGLVVGVVDERGERVFGFGRRKESGDGLSPDGDTVFEIGSVTKAFTGTLLADMVERGLVSVDDPVNKFLPSDIGPLQCDDRAMQLADLATHTSGLPRLPPNLSPQTMDDPYADYRVEEMFEFLRQQAKPSVLGSFGKSLSGLFSTKPKQKWEYSNLGVGLLGTLLSRKADRHYEELIVERICQPLNMQSTRLKLDDSMAERLIPGHGAEGNVVKNWNFECLAPCGGLKSTVRDLLKFVAANAELTPTPLQPTFARAQQSHYKVNDNLDMGLNWLLRKQGVVFHNGMTAGYNSFVVFSKPQKLGVVVLADTAIGGESGMLDRVAIPFFRSLIEEKTHQSPTIRAAKKVDSAILEKYVGKYSLVPLVATITVTCEGDRLYAQLTGQSRFRIYPESEKEFFYKVVDARITFECDADGQVERLVLHQNGKDMPAGRER